MAIVTRKLAGGRTVLWVANKWNGTIAYERVGADRRAAERRDAAMKREIKMGEYSPGQSGATTVRAYAAKFFSKRKNRSAEDELDLWKNHVERRCPWFVEMRMRDLRPPVMLKLVTELAAPYQNKKGKPYTLAPKSVSTIYGVCKTMCAAALFEEVIDKDPCVLPKDTLSRQPQSPRKPYAADAAIALTGEAVTWDRRVWNALAFYTGMREGEVCGRRFRDWDPRSRPLGSLSCTTQYRDQPLKSEKRGGERPRKIPVHPELDRILRDWWERGFEMVFCRRPTVEDFIVPHRKPKIGVHNKSTAYKAFRKSCVEAGVGNLSVHSSRHTFITWARRGRARTDVLERITHNAKGSIVDQYTHFDWAPLCEAVGALRYDLAEEQFDAELDRERIPKGFQAPAPGLELRGRGSRRVVTRVSRRNAEHAGAVKPSKKAASGAKLDARPTGPRRGFRRRLMNLVALASSGAPDAEQRVLRGMRRVLKALPQTTAGRRA